MHGNIFAQKKETKSWWCCSSLADNTLSRLSCLRLCSVLSHPGNIAATDSSDAPPHQAMHQHRYIVRLTSRHFKGYNFPPTRTKYVIAIRARNTFLLHHRVFTTTVTASIVVYVFVLPRCRRYSPSLYGPQRAARVFSEISFSCYGHRSDCQRILQPEGI